jgi:Ala-tRNA(Pro) deacylase
VIPESVIRHLEAAGVGHRRIPHPRAITAQELAASTHVAGGRVAKSVLVEADGRPWIAVLPATAIIDRDRLAEALGVRRVRLLDEDEFGRFFPDSELGAEPPFGSLYGLPVIVDEALARESKLVVRAGSHEEALEIDNQDFVRLERPRLAQFGTMVRPAPAPMEEGRWV